MTIDSHHHLWRYSSEEYGWIDDAMSPLKHDFLPRDLVAVMQEAGIDGSVAVQARQSVEETRWLLKLADECDAIRGVVGWAPIVGSEFPGVLDEFRQRKKLSGLRHILQAEPVDYMLRSDFNSGIRMLLQYGLAYDVLIYERQLPQAIEFVDRHPEQVFVLDHIAKPRIRDGMVEPWSSMVREMGKRENVWCKVSGLVTEADWTSWTAGLLKPYLDTVVDAFGPQRLLAGSDWPVCLVASGYVRWFEVLNDYFAKFSDAEREAIFGGTAIQVYKLR
ncbi:MAG: amidohydrolase family protein [Acidobacteria bacterium]|nr:amidohydrolase family protein [Acidobacteriota bacterium]